MSAIAAGTAIRANYLPFARVLAASLARRHPDVPFTVLLADEPGDRFAPEAEPFRVVELARLGAPRERLFREDPAQVVISAKAELLAHLLERGHDAALFLDADMLVLGGLGRLLTPVRRHAVTLTPHRLGPWAAIEDDIGLLRSGTYNSALVGVAARPEGLDFLAWWRDRLSEHCHFAPEAGVHYDQRWLDLAPGLFGDV